jgi:hypothetical protein
VFDWPSEHTLPVPGIYNELARIAAAFPLSPHPARAVNPRREDDAIMIPLQAGPYSEHDSVVVLDVQGTPDVAIAPTISALSGIFIDMLPLSIGSDREGVEVRYTLDGGDPRHDSPIAGTNKPLMIRETCQVRAACFRGERRVSPVATRPFERVTPRPDDQVGTIEPGLLAQVFVWDTGDIQSVEAFKDLFAIEAKPVSDFNTQHVQPRERHWGARWQGLIRVPKTGVYEFSVGSDDGSRLWIGDTMVVDNDLPHSFKVERGLIALEAGLHPIRLEFFENWGGFDLRVTWREIGHPERVVGAANLVHEP